MNTFDSNTMTPKYTACYVPSSHPLYTGNPLIDALPIIRSDDAWIEQLLSAPAFDESERGLDAHVRSYRVAELRNLFLPTANHVKVARRLDQLLRWGYANRKPFSAERVKLLQTTYEHAQRAGSAQKMVFNRLGPICSFSLIGCSGVGKSTAVERMLAAYPQCIQHPLHHLTQLVWLKVDCPKGGGVGDLADSIISSMDRILGTRHLRSKRDNASKLMAEVAHLAVAHHLGVLVLDEMQNLCAKKSGGREEMLNWFQELVNALKLPVVLLGTYKAKQILGLDMRHARRTSVNGSEVWTPLQPGEDFDFLLEQIWEYSWLRTRTPLTDELRQTMFEETQGIRAFMVDMYLVAQLHALWKGVEVMTSELFRTVARTEFSAVQPMLNALRSGDPNRLRKFDDLLPYEIDDHIERFTRLIDEAAPRRQGLSGDSGSLLARACASVRSSLGVEEKEARELVLKAMNGSHTTASALTRAALEMYFNARHSETAQNETEGEHAL